LAEYADFEAGREPKWSDLVNPYQHLVTGPSPMRHRIPRIKADPSYAEIALILAIEQSSGALIGSSGFHDFPDQNGMIELGFGIVPEKQRQGFGIELLRGMWQLILSRPDVRILRYTTMPSNEASMHIVTKLGFKLVGEQIDDEDGLELIYEMGATEYKEKFPF
jgi:RimJ/RimL family protein N-acetyltransferase